MPLPARTTRSPRHSGRKTRTPPALLSLVVVFARRRTEGKECVRQPLPLRARQVDTSIEFAGGLSQPIVHAHQALEPFVEQPGGVARSMRRHSIKKDLQRAGPLRDRRAGHGEPPELPSPQLSTYLVV